MAATSPAPNSSLSPASPTTPSPSPPVTSNPPPSTPPPSPQQSSPPNPSDPTTPTPSPPGPSSPPPATSAPPFRQPSATSPPPASGTPPPLTPALSPPPPRTVPPATPPPTPSNAPAPSTPGPPPPSAATPPPTQSNPPANSPPLPAATPPQTSPPQSSTPPENSPSPPSPPPQAQPPDNSSPPQLPTHPPENSPPPPASPEPSPSPPTSIPPSNTPPRPSLTPTPPSDPSPPSPPPKLLPPPPVAPPPPSLFSPPGWSEPPKLPSENRTDDGSGPNVVVNSNSNSNGGLSTGGVLAIGVVAGIAVLSIIGFVVWYIRKPRRRDSGHWGYIMPSSLGSSPKSDSSLMKVHSTPHHDRHAPSGTGSGGVIYDTHAAGSGGLGNSRPLFTYEELFKATNAFSAQNLLGEGGFGSVYKGYLPDGREVAVKELKIGGGQGEQEFKAEVEIISRVHHRHLVSLVGYCISEHQRLLVYDYVPNNTLYYHIHLKGDGEPVLDWEKRLKIAAGAARGIAYLHEDCHPRIIHRDIKSSNILLDENFEARVSDFGLAKLALDAQTHITTRVVGTFGYVAPEYASSGKLTERSDVYSFGVVLLELITGRKAVDTSQPMGDESLVEWARPLLNRALDNQDFERLVDPRLERKYVESEMLKMIGIAAACVRHASTKRPQMGQVVRAFDSLATSDLSNGMRFGESQAFDSAQQSAEIRFFQMLAFGNQDYSSDFYNSHSRGSSNA